MKKFDIESLKSSFNSLNPKELHNWPMWANLMVASAAFVSVLAGGYALNWSGKVSSIEKQINNEAKLKESFIEKKKQAVNLDEYKNQLKEITIASDALLKQLPNRSEMDKLLIDINQAAVSRGLTIDLFKPGTEKLTEYYAELPIAIRVTGTYENLGNFAADVSNLSRVVLFDEIKLAEIKNNKDNISMDVRAKTFRYLDQEELDKQKAIAAAAKEAQRKKNRKKK